MRGQQVPEHVHGHVDLGASPTLGPIISGPVPALGRALQRAAVADHGRGSGLSACFETQQDAQVMHDGFEATGLDPALHLIVDGMPGRQVVRDHAPGRARVHDPAQGIEHLTQEVGALAGVFGQEREIGGHEGPFLVADVAGIGLANTIHARNMATQPSP